MTGTSIDHLVSVTVLVVALLVCTAIYNQTLRDAIAYQRNHQVAVKANDLIDSICLSAGFPACFGLQNPDAGGYSLSPFALQRLLASGELVYYDRIETWFSNVSLGGGGYLLVPVEECVDYTTAGRLLGVNESYGFQLSVTPTLTVSITEVNTHPLRLKVEVRGPGLAFGGATVNYCFFRAYGDQGSYPLVELSFGIGQTDSKGSVILEFYPPPCMHGRDDSEKILGDAISSLEDLEDILTPLDPGAYNDMLNQYLKPALSYIVDGNYLYIDHQNGVKNGETFFDMLQEAADKRMNNFLPPPPPDPGALDPETEAELKRIQEEIVTVARLLTDTLLTGLEKAGLTDPAAINEADNGEQCFGEAPNQTTPGDQIAKYKDAWKQGVKALELEWGITTGIAKPPYNAPKAYAAIVYAHLSGLVGVGSHSRGTVEKGKGIIPVVENFEEGKIMLVHAWDVHGQGTPVSDYFYNSTFLLLTENFELRQMEIPNSTGQLDYETTKLPASEAGILLVTYRTGNNLSMTMMPWGIRSLGTSVIFGSDPSGRDWVATELRQVTVRQISYQVKLAVWREGG